MKQILKKMNMFIKTAWYIYIFLSVIFRKAWSGSTLVQCEHLVFFSAAAEFDHLAL